MKGLERFQWRIVQPAAAAILPDCVAIALDGAGAHKPLMMTPREDARVIFVPLAPDRVIVGVRDGGQAPGLEELNAHLAACAHRFFVAKAEGFNALIAQIGAVTEKEVAEIVDGAFTKRAEAGESFDILVADDEPAPLFKPFPLSFPAEFDMQAAQGIARVVGAAATGMHEALLLDHIGGVVFAGETSPEAKVDVGAWLVSPGLLQVTTEAGALSAKVVLPLSCALALLEAEGAPARGIALHALLHGFARVAAIGALMRKYPDFYKMGPGNYRHDLACGVHDAVLARFGTMVARSTGPREEIAKQTDEAAVEIVTTVDRAVADAHATHAKDGDYGRLFHRLLECVAAITCCCAALGDPGEPEDHPLFAAALAARGMTAWRKRFCADLAAFWRGESGAEDPGDLGVHTERLLLLWGVLTWPLSEGGYYIWVGAPEFRDALAKGIKSLPGG